MAELHPDDLRVWREIVHRLLVSGTCHIQSAKRKRAVVAVSNILEEYLISGEPGGEYPVTEE